MWFSFAAQGLEERLAAWSSEEGEDVNDNRFCYKLMTISPCSVKQTVGQNRITLHKFERFVGVFESMSNTRESSKLRFIYRLSACLLAEFVIEMIVIDQYSIMECFRGNGL